MWKEVIKMAKPKYLMIKNDLQEKIMKDIYPVDSKIPSEMELTEKYDVSRHTVRQALSKLVTEGYLRTVQGSGNYVSDQYLKSSNHTIGIITSYLSNYIFPTIFRGIEKELNADDYSLMIASTQNNVEKEQEILENMLEHDLAGLIVEPTKSNLINPNINYYLDIVRKKTPILMLHARYEELDIPYIAMDDFEAGKMATQHLIDLSYKKIAIITKTDDLQGKNRFKGYIAALQNEKMTYQKNHVILYDTETKDDLPLLIHEMLTDENSPNAVVCYNDLIAMILIEEIKKLGLKVPEDIAIVSHDDSFLSTSVSGMSLTSIEHPKEKMGKEAAKWLIHKIENPQSVEKSIIYPPHLIIRESTQKNTLNK